MKRTQSDSRISGQVVIQGTIASEVDVPTHMTQRPTKDDARAYLQAVKKMLQNEKGKYDAFSELLKDFDAKKNDKAGLAARVKDLFKEHRALICGFNEFLPKDEKITFRSTKKSIVEIFEQLSRHAVNIDTMFQPDEHVYKFFLENVGESEGNKIIIEISKDVGTLLIGHPDLIEEYKYLHIEYLVPMVMLILMSKTRFQTEERVYQSFLDILTIYLVGKKSASDSYHDIATLFTDHADLVKEFTHFLPESFVFDQAVIFVKKIQTRFQTEEHVCKSLLGILNMYRKGQKSMTKVYDEVGKLFGDDADLEEEFRPRHFLR